jgi:arsenite methyltransferase
VRFIGGNAICLGFQDESFDAVTSNYVYHNIMGHSKQALLLETLRVLKKGGVFTIHDIMSPRRYGDMSAFVRELKRRGYQKVELIDTANGLLMSPAEAKSLKLKGSAILHGVK